MYVHGLSINKITSVEIEFFIELPHSRRIVIFTITSTSSSDRSSAITCFLHSSFIDSCEIEIQRLFPSEFFCKITKLTRMFTSRR